jgi:hypothetical protein
MNLSTFILSVLVFGVCGLIIRHKIKRGLFSGCEDCDSTCAVNDLKNKI